MGWARCVRSFSIACFVFLIGFAPLAHAQLAGERLRQITLPSVDLRDVAFLEAIDFLRGQSRIHDHVTKVEEQRGIRLIVIDPNRRLEKRRITLRLVGASLGVVLEYATRLAGCAYRIDPYAVVVGPGLSAERPKLLDGEPHRYPVMTPGGQLWKVLENGEVTNFEIADASVAECLELLQGLSKRREKGPVLNPVLSSARQEKLGTRPITLSLRRVTFREVIEYLCEQGDLRYAVSQRSIVFYDRTEQEKVRALARQLGESARGKAATIRQKILTNQLRARIIPSLKLDGVTLDDALSVLRAETDNEINFVDNSAGASGRKIRLWLEGANIEQILSHLCAITGTTFDIEDLAVVVRRRPSVEAWITTGS